MLEFFALRRIFADSSGSHASDKTLRFVRPPWKRCKAGQLRQIPAPVHARMLTSVRRHSLQSHPYTLSRSQQCSHHMRSSVFFAMDAVAMDLAAAYPCKI